MLVGGTTGGGFETLRGDKTQHFITQIRNLQLTQNSQQYTSSLSILFLSLFSTQNNITEHPIYT